MKSLWELCKPRGEVFTDAHQDDALDLANLAEGSIDAAKFFRETYLTSGMEMLIDNVFARFAGTGSTGLIRLKQAMGGGKTHNLITVGLLAEHVECRQSVPAKYLHGVTQKIKVVSFTGRESDTPYGLWGEIARQLGKFEQFKTYYNPVLSAPGQTAWINLLKGEPVLILLDELPPYMNNLLTCPIGKGTLADVTVTALANLFNAVNKAELANVCIVLSDLNATYEAGSTLLNASFKNMDGEISRIATDIEPVNASSNDLYCILRQRLFAQLPPEKEIEAIAREYKTALGKAKQVNTKITTDINLFLQTIKEVYPFHPCVKDLFARFRENNNFQQTRGFIRLARLMVRTLYAGAVPAAQGKYLINAYDYDLSDKATYSMIKSIKPNVENAINHDVYSDAKTAVAQEIDGVGRGVAMQEIAKMILMASLGDVSGVVQGLRLYEIMGNMVSPQQDASDIQKLIDIFQDKAWYLFKDGKELLYFRNVQNVNAQMKSIVMAFSDAEGRKRIADILKEKFKPSVKDCYQKLAVFPALDELELERDKVLLLLCEPTGRGIDSALEDYFQRCAYPNRLLLLTGQKDTLRNLLDATKEQAAISDILRQMQEEGTKETDSQYQQAMGIDVRVKVRINQAIKETFSTLYYPSTPTPKQKREAEQRGQKLEQIRGLRSHEIEMKFEDNKFDPEEQIRATLLEVGKFLPQKDAQGDIFRQLIEAKIFTTRKMVWSDVLERAASYTLWPWYHPSALNDAKDSCVRNGIWAEGSSGVDKEPPLPKTSVQIREIARTQDCITLKLTPLNGDTIYYEIGKQEATEASAQVVQLDAFQTGELLLNFRCVDSTGRHPTGPVVWWYGIDGVSLRYNFYDENNMLYCELKADHNKAGIRYTTDGSNPREGAVYLAPFACPENGGILQAIPVYVDEVGKYRYGKSINVKIPTKGKGKGGDTTGTPPDGIPPEKPVWLKKKFTLDNKGEVYPFITDTKQVGAMALVATLTVSDEKNKQNYVDLSNGQQFWSMQAVEDTLVTLREVAMAGMTTDVRMEVEELYFPTYRAFLAWVAQRKLLLDELREYIVRAEGSAQSARVEG